MPDIFAAKGVHGSGVEMRNDDEWNGIGIIAFASLIAMVATHAMTQFGASLGIHSTKENFIYLATGTVLFFFFVLFVVATITAMAIQTIFGPPPQVETKPEPKPEPQRFLQSLPIPTLFKSADIVGKPGSGKTSLVTELFTRLAQDPSEPSIVVMDSQGSLIPQLARLELMQERGIFISPREVSPAINIFDLNRRRFAGYSELDQQRVVNNAIKFLTYLCENICETPLSGKQRIPFQAMCRLLMKMPEVKGRNATIEDLYRLTTTPKDYLDVMQKLENLDRDFFLNDFMKEGRTGTFSQTREQIRYRLYGILGNPAFANILKTDESTLDLFDTLNNGSIILVDTAKGQLADDSKLYGCFFIAMLFQAIYERDLIPEHKRKPTIFIIDEAHEYFPNSGGFFQEALVEFRKYKAGIVAIHHFFHQNKMDTTLQKALLGTSTKFIFEPHDAADARLLAPSIRTEYEHLMNLQKYQLLYFSEGMTAPQYQYTLPNPLKGLPSMDKEEWSEFRRRNRGRLGANRPRTIIAEVLPPDSDLPDDITPGTWKP